MTRLERKITELVSQANKEWSLYNRHETILVAVSGGKDSLVLFHLLREILPDVRGVHIRLSRKSSIDFIERNSLLDKIHIIESDILEEISGVKNCCFTCTKKRRKLILEYAESIGASKIAMGHHRDDVIETLLMNIIYSREISTLNPCQTLFDGKYKIIRPLYLVPEKMLSSLCKEKRLFPAKTVCNEESRSKRSYIKELIDEWQKDHPKINIRDNIFCSLKAVKTGFLPYIPL